MGTVNTSLCLDSDNQPTNNWCTYEAIDDYTVIVEIIFMVSLIMLTILVGKYIRILMLNRRKITLKSLSRDTILQVFALVSVWLICKFYKL